MNRLPIRRRTAARILPLVLAAATGACSVLPANRSAPAAIHVLAPEAAGASQAPRREGTETLLLGPVSERPGHDTPAIVYFLKPYEVRRYAASQWADTPGRMLAPLLVRALEATGCWRFVLRMPGANGGRFRLDVEDFAVGHEFFTRPSRVRVSLRAVLLDAQRQVVLAVRRFEAVEEAPGENAYGGVVATNRAVGKLLPQVAEWACPPTAVPREMSPDP